MGNVGCSCFYLQRHNTPRVLLPLQPGHLEEGPGLGIRALQQQRSCARPGAPADGIAFHPRGTCPEALRGHGEADTRGPLPGFVAVLSWYMDDRQLVAHWSVFGQGIRTNNDVEGWHRKLNGAAGTARPSFYVSLPLLHKDSEAVRRQVKLVKRGKLARYQRVAYRRQQGRIFELWDKYEARDLTTKQLLKACSHLTGPTEWSPSHPAFPGTYGFPAKVPPPLPHHRLFRDLWVPG